MNMAQGDISAAICPGCGHSMTQHPAAHELPVHLTAAQAKIWDLLVSRPNGFIRFGELVNELWGLDPTGGPEDTRKNIHVQVSKMRHELKGTPYLIFCERGVGYRLEVSA